MLRASRPKQFDSSTHRRAASVGFTLVELMVVVAMIGLLASVALSSYQNYIDNAAASAVTANYGEAVRAVRSQMNAAEARRSGGLEGDSAAPDNVADWLAILNPGNRSGPSGTAAYAPGTGDAATGVVGIHVTGSLDGGNLQVTVSQPAYLSLPSAAETITQSN